MVMKWAHGMRNVMEVFEDDEVRPTFLAYDLTTEWVLCARERGTPLGVFRTVEEVMEFLSECAGGVPVKAERWRLKDKSNLFRG